jgi:hypothetical protein
MAALKPTHFIGTLTWLGLVADRDAQLESQALSSLTALYSGPVGEAHGGLTRPSCSRVLGQYPRNTDIRNTRQFAIVSQEELDRTAADMGLDRLDPALLGSTMVIAGIPDFSHLPPSSRLQGEGGATLVVDMNNRPCTLPARPIENRHQGFGAKFKPAAMNRREKIRLHVPDQRSWDFLAEARG